MRNLPPAPELPSGQVNLHWAKLCDQQWYRTSLEFRSSLTSDEISRAQRFRSGAETRKYILCHALLRRLIEGYTGIPAATVEFNYSSRGKPGLANECGLRFNLSYAGNLTVLAFCGMEIGVDIERPSAGRIAREVAHLFLSENEKRELTDMSGGDRETTCRRIWTRKEALLKGIGTGLVDEMRQIEVSGAPGPVNVSTNSSRVGWAVYDIGPFLGTTGSVAVPGISRRHWVCKDYFVNLQDYETER